MSNEGAANTQVFDAFVDHFLGPIQLESDFVKRIAPQLQGVEKVIRSTG